MKKTALHMLTIVLCSTLFAQTKVILDTDIGSDCDDAGAMAVLHKLADKGEVEILGIIYSSGMNKYGVGVCDAINTYYGRGDLLLGQNLNDDVGDPRDFFSKQIATDTAAYRHNVIDSAMDMVSAYKIMLKKEQDASVTIITVGHPIGLVHLMRDEEGSRLVKSKVTRWVAMGGGGWNLSKNGIAEYLPELLNNWPCQLYLSSYGAKVITGNIQLPNTPKDNPVRKAYESFIWNCLEKGRPSWDQIAVLFAVRPELFEIHSIGRLEQTEDKNVKWNEGIDNPKQHMVLPKVSDNDMRDIIEGLMNEQPGHTVQIPQWKRFEITCRNTSWADNPFDLIFKGVFQSPSGRKLTQHGFYAGENTWKIYFMPDEKGKWTYITESSDQELDKRKGSFSCVASKLQGQLTPENNRWILKGNGGDFPIIWNPPVKDGSHWGFRGKDISDPSVQEALRFADETVGARLLGFGEIFLSSIGWAADWPQSAMPYIHGKEGQQFNLPFWDQLNAKLDAARDRGMGAYIMIYSDDEQAPDRFKITAYSQQELRLFRYVTARLACYPHILWDTGIDIGEYRDKKWIDWYARWFNQNDPWKHPVGSRTGGGSGGSMPDTGTYYSTGGASLPSRAMLLDFFKKDVPVAQTDHWRPFIGRGNWTHDKIRIALWRCGLSGAQALFPDYNQGTVKFDEVLIGGKYVGCASHFFRDGIKGDVGKLVPHDELIVSGENAIMAADVESEYVLYDEDGGSVTVDLSNALGLLNTRWYNPRTGEYSEHKTIQGEDKRTFTSPTAGNNNDWVLHIYKESRR